MKKRLAILLLVPLLLIFTPKESIAKVLDDQIDYNLSVITEYDCDLNIDKHIASIYASGGGNANTTEMDLTIILQKKVKSKWTNVVTWKTHSNGKTIVLTKEKTLDDGQYRLAVEITAKTKSKSETKSFKSTVETAK